MLFVLGDILVLYTFMNQSSAESVPLTSLLSRLKIFFAFTFRTIGSYIFTCLFCKISDLSFLHWRKSRVQSP